MELKVNLKTILLFSAFFILAGMILGFYSCSAHNTPTTPDLGSQNPGPAPGPVVNGPRTPNPHPPNPYIVPPVTPTANSNGSTGVIISGYSFSVDSDGTMTITDVREAEAVIGPLPTKSGYSYVLIDGVTLELSAFAIVGDTITGFATVRNNSPDFILINPRLNFANSSLASLNPAPSNASNAPLGVGSSASNFDAWDDSILGEPVLINYDGFSTIAMGAQYWNIDIYRACPFVFIADEDEGYTLNEGESAAHQIVLDKNTSHPVSYYMFFVSEICPVGTENPITGVPRTVYLALEENPSLRQSQVRIAMDMDYFNESRTINCGLLLTSHSSRNRVMYGGTEDGHYILTGIIPAMPSVDPPFSVITAIGPSVMTPVIDGEEPVQITMNRETFFFMTKYE